MTDAGTKLIDITPPVFDEHGHRLYPLLDTQLRQLLAGLNPQRVSQRSNSGRSLSYLEAWDVRRLLIRVFGFGGWSAETLSATVLKFENEVPNKSGGGTQFRVTAQAIVRLHIHQLGATYSEAAVSSQSNPDPGEAADFAVKTAESDALKRAAVNLGTQYGLSLYNKGGGSGAYTQDVVVSVLAQGQTKLDMDRMLVERREREAPVIADVMKRLEELTGKPVPESEEADPDAGINVGDGEGIEGVEPPTSAGMDSATATLQGGFAHPDAR